MVKIYNGHNIICVTIFTVVLFSSTAPVLRFTTCRGLCFAPNHYCFAPFAPKNHKLPCFRSILLIAFTMCLRVLCALFLVIIKARLYF